MAFIIRDSPILRHLGKEALISTPLVSVTASAIECMMMPGVWVGLNIIIT